MSDELGLSGSIGLSHNKFLAKIASDLDKPRGFSVIGEAETMDFLADKPVSLIWGVGAATRASLEKAGIRSFTDLRRWEKEDLHARFGEIDLGNCPDGQGRGKRRISAKRPMKSISNETTFHEDTAALDVLDGHLWRLAQKVSDRAKAKGIAGRVVTLKIKNAKHASFTRRLTLYDPTNTADRLYRTARGLLENAMDKAPFRLIGVGLSDLVDANGADLSPDLLDPDAVKRARAEQASDKIREKFGKDAIIKGRAFR